MPAQEFIDIDAVILKCFGAAATFVPQHFFYIRQISDGAIMEVDYLTAERFKTREGYQTIESERALDV